MLISVIIPVYNNLDTIARAITSVYNQDLPIGCHLECLVIDDGSKQNVSDFVKEHFPQVKCVTKKNGGAASARNLGISLANGEFIFFLDSDDEWLPGKLSTQMAVFMDREDIVLISGGIEDFTAEKRVVRHRRVSFNGNLFPRLAYYNPIATSTVGVRTSVLKGSQLLFSEILKTQEDWFLWFKISTRGNIVVMPNVLSRRFLQATSLTANVESLDEFEQQFSRIEALINEDSILLMRLRDENISMSSVYNFRKAVHLRNLGEAKEAAGVILKSAINMPYKLLWFQLARLLLRT